MYKKRRSKSRKKLRKGVRKGATRKGATRVSATRKGATRRRSKSPKIATRKKSRKPKRKASRKRSVRVSRKSSRRVARVSTRKLSRKVVRKSSRKKSRKPKRKITRRSKSPRKKVKMGVSPTSERSYTDSVNLDEEFDESDPDSVSVVSNEIDVLAALNAAVDEAPGGGDDAVNGNPDIDPAYTEPPVDPLEDRRRRAEGS